MRATTLLGEILGLKHARVVGGRFEGWGFAADVKPTNRVPFCSGCLRRTRRVYDRRTGRTWRHLDLAGMEVRLRYDIRRVDCRRCGVRTELVPWAEPESDFTREFEQQAAYLAQRTDKTTVSSLMRVAWTTVGSIVARVVERLAPADRLDDLRIIGVDELSYRRHHEYVTVVIDHVHRRVVWVKEGKSAATLRQFFAELGPERATRLEAVTIDMSAAYIQAVTEASPDALLVFDRFHIQRLAHDALDAVRREQARDILDEDLRKTVKGVRFLLQKNPWNLLHTERARLADVQHDNRPLYRAYLLKETLLDILDRCQPHVAERKLDEWLRWAARSRLKPFKKLARTIRKYKDGILAYVRTGLSNGRTEGLNGKARTITRRSFGLHSADSLIAMLFLCCSGLVLTPAHRLPTLRNGHPLVL
jgi:transposase